MKFLRKVKDYGYIRLDYKNNLDLTKELIRNKSWNL
jgi:hypothetical protein